MCTNHSFFAIYFEIIKYCNVKFDMIYKIN